MSLIGALLFLVACGAAAASEQSLPEATSLLGRPLYQPEILPEARVRLEENFVKAKADYQKNPTSADALIWLGRRTAYLGRYRDAIAVFTEGVEKFPSDHGPSPISATCRLLRAIARSSSYWPGEM